MPRRRGGLGPGSIPMGGGGRKPTTPPTPFGGGAAGGLAGAMPARPRPRPGGIGGGPPGLGGAIGPRAAPGAGVGAFARGGHVEHAKKHHEEVGQNGYHARAFEHHARGGPKEHHRHEEEVKKHARGGPVHDDEKQDKALFGKMFKKEEEKGEVVKKHEKGGAVEQFRRGGPVLDRYVTRKSSHEHGKEEGIHRGSDSHRGAALKGAGIAHTSTKMADAKPRVGRGHNYK